MLKKFALIGSPVKHSLSPIIHRSWFDYYDIDASYEVIDCPANQLKQCLSHLKEEYEGFNITSPLKGLIMGYLDDCQATALQVRAVNGVIVSNRHLIGFNSDIEGVQLSLNSFIFTNKKALVLGAGGAARAVVAALLREGFTITATARNTLALVQLKNTFPSIQTAQWLSSHREPFWINATSSELSEADYPCPITPQIALDLHYKPAFSAFLCRSKAGQQSNGLTMLLAQAASAFQQWHGFYPSLDIAKKSLTLLLSTEKEFTHR